MNWRNDTERMKIDKLTPEQEATFPEYVEKWTAVGRCCEPADRQKAEQAIRLMYQAGGLEPPPKIVWCSSPIASALTRSIAQQLGDKSASVRASVRDSVRNSVGDSVAASVGASSVAASVRDSVGDSVGASSVAASVAVSVRDSVWNSVVASSVAASVRDSVGDSVAASVWNSVEASVGASSVAASVWNSAAASVWNSVEASVTASVWNSVYGQHDASWLSFYRFFHDVGLKNETAKLQGLWMLCESAGWAIPHEGICWVSERTSTLQVDNANRLHCEDGPAIAYPDGWSIFCWHGVRIPHEWITDKPPTASEALTWDNMEQRRAACEIVGWVNILDELNAETIDKHANPMVGELVSVDIPDVGRERFLRVKCGTNRLFALPVPPDMDTAENAQRWLNFVPDNIDFLPSVRT